jgi:hypothetical protein
VGHFLAVERQVVALREVVQGRRVWLPKLIQGAAVLVEGHLMALVRAEAAEAVELQLNI